MENLNTFTQFMAALEDGALHRRLTEQVEEISKALTHHEVNYGAKAKARLTISLDFKSEGGITEITADSKVTLPRVKNGRSVLWTTRDGKFSRANPRQIGMFSDVNAPGQSQGEVLTA